MKKIQNKTYQYVSSTPRKIKKTKQPEQNNGGFNLQSGITHEIKIRKELHSISILDNEWNSLRKKVKYLRNETKKANIGQYLDGFGVAVLLPFGQALWNILVSDNIPLDSDKNSCWFYGSLLVIYIVIKVINKSDKFKFISSYSDLKKDIEILDDRMNEIETNLGIKEEKE